MYVEMDCSPYFADLVLLGCHSHTGRNGSREELVELLEDVVKRSMGVGNYQYLESHKRKQIEEMREKESLASSRVPQDDLEEIAEDGFPDCLILTRIQFILHFAVQVPCCQLLFAFDGTRLNACRVDTLDKHILLMLIGIIGYQFQQSTPHLRERIEVPFPDGPSQRLEEMPLDQLKASK